MSIKTAEEIEIMRGGGAKLSAIFDRVMPAITDGITTKELADMVVSEYKAEGLTSAVRGYEGFPEDLCVSINNEVVHGIPKPRRIISGGDLVTLDMTVFYRGLVVDAARTAYVGDQEAMPPETGRLLRYTEQALMAGIDAVHGNGTRVGDIGAAIQAVLDTQRLGIVRDLVGHGVGHSVHEDPNIPNYGIAGTGPTLRTGMTIAIEPMVTLGDWRVDILPDKWTVVTRDGSLAAHMEHTVLVTETGSEILTKG